MNKYMRILLVTAVAGLGVFALDTREAKADRYWNSYWGWYDNSYRPYYHRHHRRYYNNGYYGRGYYNDGYNYNYGRRYYGTRRSGGAVRVGPIGVYWR